MPRAIWNGVVIAESQATVIVEGNHYFPADAIKPEYFQESPHSTVCGWKGTASYFDVVVDGEKNGNAAWYYSQPKKAADQIQGHIAFWKGVTVED